MKMILVATDFSERSDRALRRATLLAKKQGAQIELLHVIDDEHPRRIVEAKRQQAESLLANYADTVRKVDGVSCAWEIRLASPHVGILEAIRAKQPDLLVLGPYRRQILREVFIGTTAERAIRSADCPVLVVNGVPAGNYVRIMQTTDLSEASGTALKHFSALGMGAGALNSVLHVFEAPALRLTLADTLHSEDRAHYLEEERQTAGALLSSFLSASGLPGMTQVLRHGTTTDANEILLAAKELKADLIVMSTRGRGGIQKMVLGSVAEQVLRSAPIDILAVPPSVVSLHAGS